MRYHMYMIVSSLPFKARTDMFWNMVGALGGAGISPDSLYLGEGLAHLKLGTTVLEQKQNVINEKAGCFSLT